MKTVFVAVLLFWGNCLEGQTLKETHFVKRDHDTVTLAITLFIANYTDSNLYYLNATYGRRLNDTVWYSRVNATGMFSSDIIYYAPIGQSDEIDSIFTLNPNKQLFINYSYRFVHKRKTINRRLRVIDFVFSDRSLFKHTGNYEKTFNIYDTNVKKILCTLNLKNAQKYTVTTKLIGFTANRHYPE